MQRSLVFGSLASLLGTAFAAACASTPEPGGATGARRGVDVDGATSRVPPDGGSTSERQHEGTNTAGVRRIDGGMRFAALQAAPGAVVDVVCTGGERWLQVASLVIGGGPYHGASSICTAAIHAGLADDISAGRVLHVAVRGARDGLAALDRNGVHGSDFGRVWPTYTFLDDDGQPLAAAPGAGTELPETPAGTNAPSTHPRVLGFASLLGIQKGTTRADLVRRLGPPASTFRYDDGDTSLTFRFTDGEVAVLVSPARGALGVTVELGDGDDDRAPLSSKDDDGRLALLHQGLESARAALGPPTKATPIELTYDFAASRLTLGCGGTNGACEKLGVDWTANEEPEATPDDGEDGDSDDGDDDDAGETEDGGC